jgi:protein involved in polysaccharide export with SLBB domain
MHVRSCLDKVVGQCRCRGESTFHIMIRMQPAAVLVSLLVFCGSLAANIRPNEALMITISGVPETDRADFNATYPVAENGKINLPLLGWVQAAGLNAMQLANAIEAGYRKAEIYQHPTVNVKPVTDGRLDGKRVVVGGQVRRTGDVVYREGLTLWQAVQAAGGDNEFAAVRRVQLHRGGKILRVLDLRNDKAKHTVLQENDSVIIPQKRPFEGGW